MAAGVRAAISFTGRVVMVCVCVCDRVGGGKKEEGLDQRMTQEVLAFQPYH